MKDKRIHQFENLENGSVHCYFDTNTEIIERYKNKERWRTIVKDNGWIEKELSKLINKMEQDDYIKVTYIYDKHKVDALKNRIQASKPFKEWEIPNSDNWKNIFSFEIIKPSSLDLFSYYFDSSFYKNIIMTDELNEKEMGSKLEGFIEKFMHKTKASILCDKLSPSLSELFEGEKEKESTDIDISLINPMFNPSQLEAIEKSLSMPTTIIKGPPGTGKTTTLLNIIISAYLNGKTVLVSSKNNKAVDNILELLEKLKLGQFWFRFGSRDVLKEQFDKVGSINLKETINEIEKPIINVYKSIKKLINSQSQQEQIDEALLQWCSFSKNLHNLLVNKGLNPEFSLKTNLPNWDYKNKFINILLWFKLKRKRIKALKIISSLINNFYLDKAKFKNVSAENFQSISSIIEQDLLLLKNYENTVKIISELKEKKTYIDFEVEWEKIKDNKYYYDYVMHNIEKCTFDTNKNRKKAIKTIMEKSALSNFNIRRECLNPIFINNFMKAFPIHFVTNLSIDNLPNIKYDYVILDEAGQSDIQSTIGLLQKGKHNILCGDAKQLEPIYKMSKQEDDKIANKFSIDPLFRAHGNSLLNIYSKFLSPERISFLNEHYRCPPEVVKFSNIEFYNKELKIMTKNYNNEETISLIDINGYVEPTKWVNKDEINAIVSDINQKGLDHSKIAVLSPFRDQVWAMKSHPGLKDVAVDTIFKFQGREFDYIYFSSVLGNRIQKGGKEYLNKKSIINVAITRAKKKFTLVSNVKDIQDNDPNSLIARLQSYIVHKKYNINTDTKQDIEKVWKENIEQNKFLKSIAITDLLVNIQKICRENDLYLTINTRYRDVFKNSNNSLKDKIDCVVYDKDGYTLLVINKNIILFKGNNLFDSLGLGEQLIKTKLERFISGQELSFLKMIKNLTKDDEILLSAVKLTSIVKLNSDMNLSSWILNSAKSMHFDFVICKIINSKLIPIKVIELDDSTHLDGKAIKRDKRKDWFASKAGINIKRFITYKY